MTKRALEVEALLPLWGPGDIRRFSSSPTWPRCHPYSHGLPKSHVPVVVLANSTDKGGFAMSVGPASLLMV